MQRKKAIALAALSTMFWALTPKVSAGLVSNISYDQAVEADDNYLGTDTDKQYLVGTTLPVSASVTAMVDQGSSITATYNFSDNGSSATFDISCSGTLTAIDQADTEGAGPDGPLMFTVTQPVSYLATLTSTPGQGTEDYGGIMLQSALGGEDIFYSDGAGDLSLRESGTLSPGSYIFNEAWDLSNSRPDQGDLPTGSGSDSMSFTLTAIPEPGSLGMLILGGSVILARRRRAIV